MKTKRALSRRVYHLVEAVNWPSVQRRGLLSAQQLMRAAGHNAIAQHRPRCITLADGTLIRDQAPMPPSALKRCLTGGVTPDEWYALLNSWVFFWFDRERLLRQARACAPRPQLVLTFDVERLLANHREQAALSPFNTGFARRRPTARSRNTFVPYSSWLQCGWTMEAEARNGSVRPNGHAPVELVIADAVPDVLEFVVDAQPLATVRSSTTTLVRAPDAFLERPGTRRTRSKV